MKKFLGALVRLNQAYLQAGTAEASVAFLENTASAETREAVDALTEITASDLGLKQRDLESFFSDST